VNRDRPRGPAASATDRGSSPVPNPGPFHEHVPLSSRRASCALRAAFLVASLSVERGRTLREPLKPRNVGPKTPRAEMTLPGGSLIDTNAVVVTCFFICAAPLAGRFFLFPAGRDLPALLVAEPVASLRVGNRFTWPFFLPAMGALSGPCGVRALVPWSAGRAPAPRRWPQALLASRSRSLRRMSALHPRGADHPPP